MRKNLLISLAVSVMALLQSGGDIYAASETKQQPTTPAVPENNIVTVIEEESAGNVEIDIPDDILDDILNLPPVKQPNQLQRPSQAGSQYKKGVNRVNGYRIMVFSDGRNASTLQSRARARGNAVAARFPKYRGQVYAYSKSPNWYCTVGNFRTSGEAASALAELKRAFPQFAAEMRVVSSNITVKK